MNFGFCLLPEARFANVYIPAPSLFIWFAEGHSAEPGMEGGVQKGS
jgi:hypothetical protein